LKRQYRHKNKKAQLLLGKARYSLYWSCYSNDLQGHPRSIISMYTPVIWNSVYNFLWTIHSNFGPIFHRFRDTATYTLKLSIENCGQTVADGDTVTIDSL